jgi:hypothetical protein
MATLIDTDYAFQPDDTKILLAAETTDAIAFGFHWSETGAGAQTFTGTISKLTTKTFTGALTFAGALVRLTNKVVAGALTFTSTISQMTRKVIAMLLDVQIDADGHLIDQPTNEDD